MTQQTATPVVRVRSETHFGRTRLYPVDDRLAELILGISNRLTIYDPSTDGPDTSAWLELFKLLGVEVVEQGAGDG